MRISDTPAGWEETQDKREEAGGRRWGGGVGLRERDEKREPGKKYHLFFRHGQGR